MHPSYPHSTTTTTKSYRPDLTHRTAKKNPPTVPHQSSATPFHQNPKSILPLTSP
ncbi:unnamed protein product [Coffea canephora]|uniref:Uncharacterized protein n=1 Tax=Coffea canephora TaxID=49390 RepID=A0A068TW92_COFCA|nr:unnamed protein product [Coffea canephora]